MNKKTYIILGTIAAIVLIGLALYVSGVRFRNPVIFLSPSQHIVKGNAPQPFYSDPNNPSLNTLQEISGGNATEQVSYQQAADLYKDSHLVFDPNCRVRPVTLAVPPKSVVMLDNQSKWQRTVIVGPRTYTIMPYDYVLASFNESGAYGITCDSVEDVGFISVQ